MKSINLLYFEDISPIHEPVFAFPIIGKLSMRQISIIGISGIISWLLYQAAASPLALVPLCLGAYVGLKKFNVKPIESQLVSVIRFLIFNPKENKPLQKRSATSPRSKKLGFPEPFLPKLEIVGKEIKTRDVFADPLKPIRLQIRLETPQKQPISNTQTKVEFDGNIVSTLATNNNGEIEVLVIPQSLGKKRLVIYAEGFKQPVFEEILHIKSL